MENLTVRDLMVPADQFPKISSNVHFYEALAALETAQKRGYRGRIIASIRYQDENNILEKAGIDAAYVIHKEAGVGFANYASQYLNISQPTIADTAQPNGERL